MGVGSYVEHVALLLRRGLWWTLVLTAFACMFLVTSMALFDQLPKQENRVHFHTGLVYHTDQLLPQLLKNSFSSLREMQNRSDNWQVAEYQPVQGYVDRHSIIPGGKFRIHLARHPELDSYPGHLEIWKAGAVKKKIDSSPLQDIAPGPLYADSASVGFTWQALDWKPDTINWRSGFYQVDFVAEDGVRSEDIAFIVVTNPRRDGDILLKLSTNTWAAYNRNGGHDLYASRSLGSGDNGRGQMVSFDRPLTPGSFHSASTWAMDYIPWLEGFASEHGLTVDYAGNFDLDYEPGFARDYPLIITVGHDEYWSLNEYRAMWDRIHNLGKSVLFLSANTAYWQVRYSDVNNPSLEDFQGRQMLCFKSDLDPVRYVSETPRLHVTSRFRDNNRLPETNLMGVGFESFSNSGQREHYVVQDTDFPFFVATNYKSGDKILNVVGHEWDNRRPQDNAWDRERDTLWPEPSIAPRVVFRSELLGINGQPSLAEAVYFKTEAGARVFSAGTNSWVWGLRAEGDDGERFRLLNEQLVEYLLTNNQTNR